ncbi:MAG: DUF58 domain-containing protein [Peptococcaceae bacterium]
MNSNNAVPSFTSLFAVGFVRFSLFIILVITLRNKLWLPGSLLIALLVTVEGAFWWSKLGLKNVVTEKTLFPLRTFPGEKTELSVKITNNKYLPVIITWQQNLPGGICFRKDGEDSSGESITLLSYEKYAVSYEIQALRRGIYQIPGFRLISRDGLGLFYQERLVEDSECLIVYPQIIPFQHLNIKAADLIGEKRDNRPMLPDPIRITGLRDYTPEMPARLIHWKSSCNRDSLLAKILEPSADFKIYIIIDVEYFYHADHETDFERALSVAASLLVWADDNNIPFGILVNGLQHGFDGPVVINSGSGTDHLLLALEKLARLFFIPSGPLEDLQQLEIMKPGYGATCISIGSELGGRTLWAGRTYHYRI